MTVQDNQQVAAWPTIRSVALCLRTSYGSTTNSVNLSTRDFLDSGKASFELSGLLPGPAGDFGGKKPTASAAWEQKNQSGDYQETGRLCL